MSDELENLAQQLKDAEALLAEASEELAPIEEQRNEIDKEEAEARAIYQAAMARARQKKQELDNDFFNAQSKANKAKREAEALRRAIEEAERQKKIEQERLDRELELLLLNEKWDRLTLGAPWREFAKDHQIKAGHKLVQDRKVILADPMGLGKTLSSILACDMIRAATKHASPNNPFLGDEVEQYVGEHFRNKVTGEKKYIWDFNLETQAEIKDGTHDTYEYVPSGYQKVIVNSVTRQCGNRVLYICPSSLIRNVMKEFRLWAGHRNVTFVGGMPKASRQFVFEHVLADQQEFVVICNYEAWRKDLSLLDEFIKLDFDTVIIDEAHNLKEMKTSAYRGVKQILDQTQPPYVIPMTGTPILNRPQELFSLLTLVNPQDFHTLNDFLFTYCEQDDDKFWKFQPGGLDRIAKRIGKNFMRRTRDQAGIVLPEKTIINHDLEVDKEKYPLQAKARKQMATQATIMMEETSKAGVATAMIAVFTRLRQIETWPCGMTFRDPITKEVTLVLDIEESQKVDYIISKEPDEAGDYSGLIPEAIADERMVLFSQFKLPLKEIANRVEKAGYRPVILDGDTPNAVREEILNDFDRRYTPKREDSRWDIVLCNYKVGGVGANFTAATQMVILDEEWNPGKRDQAYDRLHRIGQEEAITIHVVRNQGTIDDWLANIMENKEGLVEGFNSKMVDADEFKDFLDKGGLA